MLRDVCTGEPDSMATKKKVGRTTARYSTHSTTTTVLLYCVLTATQMTPMIHVRVSPNSSSLHWSGVFSASSFASCTPANTHTHTHTHTHTPRRSENSHINIYTSSTDDVKKAAIHEDGSRASGRTCSGLFSAMRKHEECTSTSCESLLCLADTYTPLVTLFQKRPNH